MNIIIEYNGGKMIVTHPSGIVNMYTKEDIEEQKEAVEREIKLADDELQYYDEIIRQIVESMPKQSFLTRVKNLFTRKKKDIVR